jgi:hypothetical protein
LLVTYTYLGGEYYRDNEPLSATQVKEIERVVHTGLQGGSIVTASQNTIALREVYGRRWTVSVILPQAFDCS